MKQLKILQNTTFKRSTLDASTLADHQKFTVAQGSVFNVLAFSEINGHIVVTLDGKLGEFNTWYVFHKHGLITDNGAIVAPSKIELPVPYYCQLDNQDSPYGTCNVTSIAMVLSYFGIKQRTKRRFPDELEDYCQNHGLDRHVGEHLAEVAQAYGIEDKFTRHATVEQIKEHLIQGNPCIVHGYFTQSGHILVLTGFNERGWKVNDPYGEWCPGGYDTYASGKQLTYSYQMMRDTCEGDGEFWVHFLSK